jgi:type II secretory pathway pseudopilin PulG|uniref:Uncharacterized protein n=1 Tax=Desulfobacca acetoxidans TaxID=60893 RepID=A0A7V6DPY1_9BACT
MTSEFGKVFGIGVLILGLMLAWTAPGLAGAYQDAQKLKNSGNQAQSSAQGTKPNLENARTQAGSGWDTKYQSPPPAVHLPNNRVGVNPQDLKKYDPKPMKLQKVVPPPPTPSSR